MTKIKNAYQVEFKKSAAKEIKKLDQSSKSKIKEAIILLSINPRSEILNVKKLKTTEELYRLRVGNFRILYTIENNRLIITIVKVAHRKNVYRVK